MDSKREKVRIEAHGGKIDIQGVTVAKVDDKLRLQSVETWFDPMEMFRQIVAGRSDDEITRTPMSGDKPEDSGSEEETSSNHPNEEAKVDKTKDVVNNGLSGGLERVDLSAEKEGTSSENKTTSHAGGCPFMH
jgi:hypothetical protein